MDDSSNLTNLAACQLAGRWEVESVIYLRHVCAEVFSRWLLCYIDTDNCVYIDT